MAIKDFRADIDWDVVDEILTNEMFEELPILSLDQKNPTLATFAKEYPNYDEANPEDIVKAYFDLITKRDIQIEDSLIWTDSLEEVATVQPAFYKVKAVMDAAGISLKLTLNPVDMTITRARYKGRSDSILPLEEETLNVLIEMGCDLPTTNETEIPFTHPAVIDRVNQLITESLTFHKEKMEEALQTIIHKTERRIIKDDVYLVD